MTKAISDAQKANSWQGEPGNLYAQARALEPSLVFPAAALATMKTSTSFKAELPVDRQVELGLATDARDFNLGALYYQSSPTILAVVTKGGAADKMGFKSGDRILSVDGQGDRLRLAVQARPAVGGRKGEGRVRTGGSATGARGRCLLR